MPRPYRRWRDPEFAETLRRLYSLGWSDTEVGLAVGLTRKGVSRHRKRLGIPASGRSDHYRQRVRERTAHQCMVAGVANLAQVRAMAFRRYAATHGLPESLTPREVQVVQVLRQRGPMTRREIADAIGVAWKGSRKSLQGKKNSYLAMLMARGLVVSLGRLVAEGKGRGRSVHVYAAALEG